ncbi:chemosensory receptor a [Plakobranchus ocellatus]|uniref:Chemosensory receptor a n=1 Tax=Plakobranchus ocellatus TaxID=259542 RepID=A0AAV4BYZ0_9GAST|nr:chemosensory receptor a [Plakobranchus ocellatus]
MEFVYVYQSPLTTRTVRWVDSIPDSTWEEKEVEDSRRRSRRDDSAGKEVGIEDKSQVEKEMSPCPDDRQSIGDNLPWSPLTTRGNHGGAYSSPGPTRGAKTKEPRISSDRNSRRARPV